MQLQKRKRDLHWCNAKIILNLLQEVVIDNDSSTENRKHKFFATNISYTGTLKLELKDKTFKTNCGEAFCVNANGTVVTNFVISDTMKGVAKLQLVANDSAGSTTASLKVKRNLYDIIV